jgi:hypothetical protein
MRKPDIPVDIKLDIHQAISQTLEKAGMKTLS